MMTSILSMLRVYMVLGSLVKFHIRSLNGFIQLWHSFFSRLCFFCSSISPPQSGKNISQPSLCWRTQKQILSQNIMSFEFPLITYFGEILFPTIFCSSYWNVFFLLFLTAFSFSTIPAGFRIQSNNSDEDNLRRETKNKIICGSKSPHCIIINLCPCIINYF